MNWGGGEGGKEGDKEGRWEGRERKMEKKRFCCEFISFAQNVKLNTTWTNYFI